MFLLLLSVLKSPHPFRKKYPLAIKAPQISALIGEH